jgi:hypothetical protein
MTRFVILFARYIAAIIVACFASAVIFFPSALLLGFLGIGSLVPYLLIFAVMGFCGVFSGCLCLEQTSRGFGSIVLLVLGLAYYVHWMVFIHYREGESKTHPYGWVIGLAALAVGGLVAVIFAFRHSSPNTSLEPTATALADSTMR